jgi:hypothetical protein
MAQTLCHVAKGKGFLILTNSRLSVAQKGLGSLSETFLDATKPYAFKQSNIRIKRSTNIIINLGC